VVRVPRPHRVAVPDPSGNPFRHRVGPATSARRPGRGLAPLRAAARQARASPAVPDAARHAPLARRCSP